ASFEVWHSTSGSPMTPRGTLHIAPSRKSGTKYEAGAGGTAELARVANPAEVYQVRFTGIVHGVEVALNSSVPLCQLQSARFREYVTVHLDETGVPYHIDYVVPSSSCSTKGAKSVPFKTNVFVQKPVDGI
ncbi:hypothetical protein HK405_014317, partial [Cladochytrium tenue]